MTKQATPRKRALIGLTAVAFSALTVLAPTAFAQVSTQVPDVQDAVGSTTGTVKDTVDTTAGGTGGTTDTVNDTGGTVDKTTDAVKDVVDTTGGTVDTTTGTSTYEDTKKTVTDTADSAEDTVSGTTKEVNDTVSGAGGTVLNPDLTIKDRLLKEADADGDGKLSKKERKAAGSGSRSGAASSRKGDYRGEGSRAGKPGHGGRFAGLTAFEKKHRLPAAPISARISAPQRESFITQLAQAAQEAAKKLAFPLGLALMVGAFLMVQGRIDRKDAKLALAPIDSEQDLLSFQ